MRHDLTNASRTASIVSSSPSPNGGGLDSDAGSSFTSEAGVPLGQLSPRWKDETHVGWITFVGPDASSPLRAEWELYVVEDAAGASAARVMHCAGSSPTSFDFLADGTIVAATRHVVSTPNGNQTPMDLLVYRTNGPTGECEVVRNLTNNTKSDVVARDLTLSPDKSQIAFFSGTGTGISLNARNDLALFVVPLTARTPAPRSLVPVATRIPASVRAGPPVGRPSRGAPPFPAGSSSRFRRPAAHDIPSWRALRFCGPMATAASRAASTASPSASVRVAASLAARSRSGSWRPAERSASSRSSPVGGAAHRMRDRADAQR